jgi:hypothetical protein
MDMTESHMQVLYGAWAAAQDGGGIVVDGPDLFVEAHELAEHGWLERRFVGDDLAWVWTDRASIALALNDLTSGLSPN